MVHPGARMFWIEAGAMQGGSRNQLEVTDDLAEFFGDQARTHEIVLVQIKLGELIARPLVYRAEGYGHKKDRWRLSLPTAKMGGPKKYAGGVIRFDKIDVGGNTAFQLTVAQTGSSAHQEWQVQSVAPKGGSGKTSWGRGFGWSK